MNMRATAAVRLMSGDREPVRLASTTNLALVGLVTVDGVAAAAGDRILVKNQTDATQNGIYTASAGTWYRAPDSNSSRTLIKGMKVAVQEGATHADQVWNLVTNRPDIGDDDIEWEFYLSSDMVTQINNAANDIIATIIALTNAADFASRAIAAGTTLPSGMTYLRTAGYATAGDGGGALYKKVGAQPTHSGKFQSADGAWWEVVYLGQPMNLLQFGALGDDSTDDRAAIQGAIDFVSAAGGGILRGIPGKTYRCVINTGVTSHGLVLKPNVTLDLCRSTISLRCTGDVFGVRVQSNATIENGTVATTLSSSLSSGQAIYHTPISLGSAYGDYPTVGSVDAFASPSGWKLSNLTVTNVRADSPTPGGEMICIFGGAHHGLIEDITIPDNATVGIAIGMDWMPVGPFTGTDLAALNAAKTAFNSGQAYTLHPHEIDVQRINIGNMSAPNTGSFGSHGIRLSGCYSIRVDGVTVVGSTYAGIYHTAGDFGFEFAPTAVKDFRLKGIVFRNVTIENANNGYGVFCDAYADNIDAAVSLGYSSLLPTITTTDILFDNVFTQGSLTSSAIAGFRITYADGGEFRNCRARRHSAGVFVDSHVSNLKIIGGNYNSNWVHGIQVDPDSTAEDILIDGARCFSNGLGLGGADAGIYLANTLRPVVQNCTLGINGENFQDFGLRCVADVQDAIILNNYCDGAAGTTPAYSIASGGDYGVLAQFNGNRCRSTVTTKYGGVNIIPYDYVINSAGDVVLKCRASNAALVSATTPSGGSWKRGTIIEFDNPSAGGAWGTVCVSSGAPGTWKTIASINA
ncbi:hypothetical protein I6F09_04905 [Bradyrhizobium sp. IC3195]|uniref:hypothetical protein n=1 Tax=Bradyrhizobium sp. IC3195 TaxID=2793804 RepID=UPI001CD5DC8B|nr:hypothetical protein [Bradyrhizobium sp. IC3195]MCA1467226.1 hypothetical protein [Bradyrhizobium sp. IC3195]